MNGFTPWSGLGGGLMIGLAAVLLLWCNGRIAGVSGIAGGLWFSSRSERSWRRAFLAGLLLGTGVWVHWFASIPLLRPRFPTDLLALSGLLVGYGTSLAGGCTSGHGVCGVARISRRSLAATADFLLVAISTTYLARHISHLA
jgi:uncharacterized membrane protein YedE/YeeE